MKKKAWLLASGIVIIGIWAWNGSSPESSNEVKPTPVVSSPTPDVPDVKVSEVPSSSTPTIPTESPTPSSVTVSEIKPQPTPSTSSETPVLQLEKEKKQVKVPLTNPEKTTKPTEPPKPKVKEPQKVQDPASPPEYEEKETKPNKETAAEPKAGDKNNKGKVYVPGFGWVEDQGGGTQEITVGKDGDELTGNKVGTMD